MTYKFFEKFLNEQFTRMLVIASVLLVAIALFMGKMSGSELTAALGLILGGYVAKRSNDVYQDRKTIEAKTDASKS